MSETDAQAQDLKQSLETIIRYLPPFMVVADQEFKQLKTHLEQQLEEMNQRLKDHIDQRLKESSQQWMADIEQRFKQRNQRLALANQAASARINKIMGYRPSENAGPHHLPIHFPATPTFSPQPQVPDSEGFNQQISAVSVSLKEADGHATLDERFDVSL
ncbi:hypothetical protein V565_089950 [Rhizoctonia solani 123E]|uniref:Uncharacterized protein n=1 Tax=Rhizoctonia solani 123E TaxID=1423351 RepID=A0A074RZ49_9AGAM|nr:hypothetical protein V565_089950 [Rhizoctonia solani 123E]